MAPPKSSQSNYSTKLKDSPAENLESVYEDPDALRPSKLSQSNYSSAENLESVYEDPDALRDYQADRLPTDCQRPRPVRPPPRPPASMKPKAGVGAHSNYRRTQSDPAVQSLRSEKTPPPLPPWPDQAPSSPVYYDQTCPGKSLRSEVTNRPVAPPRLYCSETSPAQVRPPPPALNPPPPPSVSSESLHTPYLEVLPDHVDYMSLSLRSGLSEPVCQSGFNSVYQESTEEDINGLRTWMRTVSRYDFTAPSMYGLSTQEEVRLFNERAFNVAKMLRAFSLFMMKGKDNLQSIISEFRSISEHLDKVKKKTKAMGIAGGATGAVGGATAMVGIVLAPMTMGISLVATAVGATMVASAGGMGAHAAKANKKVVNRMTVEKLVHDYREDIVDLEHCLGLILCAMNELQRYDTGRLQRAGAHPEALRVAHKFQAVFRNNMDASGSAACTGRLTSDRLLQVFTKDMDQFFTEKNGQNLKKSNKSRFSGRVELLANNLQEELDYLNQQWQAFS
ncbi:uncharacterized protein LOC114439486 isoform X2 [Parambassis ranga]|uniref:Uncharacterized protein LOC114439486 isoform X2 n=1 Tax=Parambassis ranga TaxID=210632 RepID=A0A6P7IG94_9TELE|nr:uncharacterized protein LOC114439486 isoform X2 [Parambassis ranga]